MRDDRDERRSRSTTKGVIGGSQNAPPEVTWEIGVWVQSVARGSICFHLLRGACAQSEDTPVGEGHEEERLVRDGVGE